MHYRQLSCFTTFAPQNQYMAAVLFYLILKPLSLLPFWILYAKSNVLRFILYNIFKYRVGVIRGNIERSFPEKSAEERLAIEKEFYKHLCDLIVESIKFFSISREKAYAMMETHNAEILDDLYKKGKTVILVGGHYANWELYALTAPRDMQHDLYALYTPLSNSFFDTKMSSSRGRFGLTMKSIKNLKGLFEEETTKPRAYIFGADQSPRNPEKAYWMNFLTQETGVQFGTEKTARDYNCAVVYGELDKVKRGQFAIRYTLICEDPGTMAYGEITEAHTRQLEKKIKTKPYYWLWSHKRWKHARPKGATLH